MDAPTPPRASRGGCTLIFMMVVVIPIMMVVVLTMVVMVVVVCATMIMVVVMVVVFATLVFVPVATFFAMSWHAVSLNKNIPEINQVVHFTKKMVTIDITLSKMIQQHPEINLGDCLNDWKIFSTAHKQSVQTCLSKLALWGQDLIHSLYIFMCWSAV